MASVSEYAVMAEQKLRSLGLDKKSPASLYAPAEYALTAGGKRLRPALLLMAAEAFGGKEAVERALSAAAGIEMYHNFTLLHDDVMDRSEVRRGRPTVHMRWNEATAILSGDAMLTMATQLIAEVPDECLRRVLTIFNATAMEVYDGQAMDMDFESRDDVSVEEYTSMIVRKTGALLGGALAIGAVIGGASNADVERMNLYGRMLGIAFQIEDDRLDTFGDASTFGKKIGGDILNDKKTFLMVSALEAKSPQVEALRAALKLSGELKIKTVTNILTKMGMEEECRKAADAYSAKAIGALRGSALSDEAKAPFIKLVEKLSGRKR